MSYKLASLTTYEAEKVIQPIYSGGDAALDGSGAILATCLGEDFALTDLRTGERLSHIEGDGELLTALSITPAADHVITCSRSLSLKIYSVRAIEQSSPQVQVALTKTLKPHNVPVITLSIDGTGSLLATGAADGIVKVWDIRGGFQTHTFHGHSGVVSALRFFQDTDTTLDRRAEGSKGRRTSLKAEHANGDNALERQASSLRLASGGEDGKIRIWKLQQRKSAAVLDSHVSVVRDIHFAAETKTLLSISRDKTAIIWDAHSWKLKKIIPILETIETAGFLAAGAIFYTGGERGYIRLWDSAAGKELALAPSGREKEDSIIKTLFIRQNNVIISIHGDQSLLFHSVHSEYGDTLHQGKSVGIDTIRRISGTYDEIIDLAFVTPGKRLLALATNSEDIRLVSIENSPHGQNASSPSYFGADVASLKGHSEIVISISADNTGQWLATGAKDNTARLWYIDQEVNAYDHYATFTGHAESIGAVTLPNHSTHDYTNDMDARKKLPRFLLTGSNDRTIKRWMIPKTALAGSKAEFTRKAHDKDINALAISPSSTLFASASQDRTVKIWSMDGETQGILRGHKRGVWSVVFAPKGTPQITDDAGASASTSSGLVVTGSGDKTVKIWSLNDYSCIRTFEGHTNNVLKVLWLPASTLHDGQDADVAAPQPQQATVASAGADGLVKIWSPFTGECLTTLDNHTDRVWALAHNPVTGALVSGGGDSVVTFWGNTSKQTAEERTRTQVERVEQDQELQNCEREGNWREGIVLALQLNHPARLLGIFRKVVGTTPKEEGSISGVKAVDEVIANLADEQLLTLLMRVRDWNTNARTAPVAQRILSVVVRRYSPDRLARLGKRRGGREVIAALRAYTERHYVRMRELEEESWIVEFLLSEMDQLGVNDKANGATDVDSQDVIMV